MEPASPVSSPPTRGWTPTLRQRFINNLRQGGDVQLAARTCGLSRQSVYRLRQRDAAFAAAWDAALVGLWERQRQALASSMADAETRLRSLMAAGGVQAERARWLLEQLAELAGTRQ